VKLHLRRLLLFFADGRTPEMPKDVWVFWLNLTNIALGVVVFLAVLVVAYALVWEIVSRYKKPRNVANLDEELEAMSQDGLSVPGLGVTMADGGERFKPLPEQPARKKRG
jgi:hypothetical protein